MDERGIDISRQRSKHLDELVHERFTYVVTVCDDANEVCPVFPHGAKKLHWSIPDPSAVTGEEEDRRRAFAAAADDLDGPHPRSPCPSPRASGRGLTSVQFHCAA